MKITSLLQEGITAASSPENATNSAPQMGRSEKFLEDQIDETTSSGSVASVATPVGGMQRRGKGSIFSGIKTSSKFPNSQAVKEGESMSTFAALKDWRVWDVHVYNNFYRGKYADYGPRLYSVVASSPEEARQVVINNPDYVLQDLLSRKLVSGKKVLPRGSALPIEEKRVGKAEPGTITTMAFKKMLTPDGVQSFKFTNGKIVDGAHMQGGEQLAEVDPHNFDSDVDYYNAVKKQGQQQFSGDWDVWDEIASLENQIKYTKSSALAHTLYQKIDQLKQQAGIQDDEDEYEKEYDADIQARKGMAEGGFDSYTKSTSNTNTTPELRGVSIPGNMKHPEWREPAWSFQEIAEKLGLTVGELNGYIAMLPGFPKRLEGVKARVGSKSYFPRSQVKRWVNSTDIRNLIKAKKGLAEQELAEKSKSQTQFRTMAAVAHNPKFAKKVGISQKVGKEFHKADKKQDYKSLPKEVDEAQWYPDHEYIPKAPRKRKPQTGNRVSDIRTGSPKIYYKNGKAVGEVGIDPEASPGNGSYYMKHYLSGRALIGYDTPLEASKELAHLVRQEGVAEGVNPGEDYQLSAAKNYAKAAKVAKQKGDNVAYVQATLDYHANMMTHHFLNDRHDEGEKHEALVDRYEALLNQLDPQSVSEGTDDEPFNYDEWKASTVKPRKPRGYKDAEAIGQQQKEIDRERKEKENQGLAEGDWFDARRAKKAAEKSAASAEAKVYTQHGITARKHGGDDAYSWAVFINGRPFVTGLGKSEVPSYKKQALKSVQEKQGVAEGYQFKGGFPFDVDHMPGAVYKHNSKPVSSKKWFTDKNDWDRAVDKINAEVFDDMSDFRIRSEGESVTGHSTVWAKWDNAKQKGYIDMGSMSESVSEEKQRLDAKCWTGYKKQGTKMKGDTRVNNCVPVSEDEISEDMLAHDLYKDLQIFKKGADKDIGAKAKDKEISGKAKDKEIIAKVTKK